jgi:RNA recognition motif-containing protein
LLRAADPGNRRDQRGPLKPKHFDREDSTIPRKVFVGNLSFNTNQDRLKETFAGAGNVVSVHVGMDRETGRSRGFAFVEFSTDEEAANAITRFNEFDLDGRKLRVNAAEDRPPRRGPGGPGGGGFSPPPRSFSDFGGGGGGGGGGESNDFGGGFGKPFNKPKGSRRGIRARKRSLG